MHTSSSESPHCQAVNLSNVIPFVDPYRQRLAQVRSWFNDQANDKEGHVAALTIAVAGSGALNVRGCTIGPGHAELMLGRLDAIRERLERIASKGAASVESITGHECRVIPMRRSA